MLYFTFTLVCSSTCHNRSILPDRDVRPVFEAEHQRSVRHDCDALGQGSPEPIIEAFKAFAAFFDVPDEAVQQRFLKRQRQGTVL